MEQTVLRLDDVHGGWALFIIRPYVQINQVHHLTFLKDILSLQVLF